MILNGDGTFTGALTGERHERDLLEQYFTNNALWDVTLTAAGNYDDVIEIREVYQNTWRIAEERKKKNR